MGCSQPGPPLGPGHYPQMQMDPIVSTGEGQGWKAALKPGWGSTFLLPEASLLGEDAPRRHRACAPVRIVVHIKKSYHPVTGAAWVPKVGWQEPFMTDGLLQGGQPVDADQTLLPGAHTDRTAVWKQATMCIMNRSME